VEHVITGGVHGLFLLGTTGEGPSLSYRLRREFVERVCELNAGRVPILVGITDTSFSEAVQMAEWAAECEAQAVVVAPPYYFVASQAELDAYCKRLAETVELPVFLYNMPGLTKVAFEPDTVARLMDVPSIVGLKDSSAQMIYFHKVRLITAARPDFTLLIGPEELLGESVLLGGHGGICGGANLVPGLYVTLYEAARVGDLELVRTLHERVIRLSNLLYTIGTPNSSYLRGLKCALSCLGLCEDMLAEPYRPFAANERKMVEERLKVLGLEAPAHLAMVGKE
jgi:4-hydroxy-tetrahydrodipicolinate synthase